MNEYVASYMPTDNNQNDVKQLGSLWFMQNKITEIKEKQSKSSTPVLQTPVWIDI